MPEIFCSDSYTIQVYRSEVGWRSAETRCVFCQCCLKSAPNSPLNPCLMAGQIIMKSQVTNDPRLRYNPDPIVNESRLSQFTLKLGQLWKKFVDALIERNEIKIEVLEHKFGNTYWVAHDPLTGRRLYFHSEAELRTWCDRRYYHNRYEVNYCYNRGNI